MENSFSLQFNKMTQLKTVQDYEAEITRLQNENWEIKHQLAFLKSNAPLNVDDDIQKLLYDSKTSIDILENENKNFQKQIDHLKEIIRSNGIEKEKMLKDYNDKINDTEGKLLSLEDENQRLITHIENVKNKYESVLQVHKLCDQKIENFKHEQGNVYHELEKFRNENECLKNEINNLRTENLSLKNEINKINSNYLNLQKENFDIKNDKATYYSEGEKLLKENEHLQTQYKIIYDERGNLLNMNSEYKNKLASLENECRKLEKNVAALNNELENYKETELYIKELQRNFNKETRNKQNLAIENEKIKEDLEMANKKIEILNNEKRAMRYKLKQDDGYIFKHAITELNKCYSVVNEINEKVKKLQYSKETLGFLQSLNIKSKNINFIVNSFKTIYGKMKDRIEVLRREAHDLNKFGKNEKLLKVIKEFTEEFRNAKLDLDSTKKYLEQKNIEIKEMKKQKLSLEKMYNNLLQKYNHTVCKL